MTMQAGVVLVVALLPLAAEFEPARLISGSLPQQPPNVVGWTEVMLDLEVDAGGTVGEIMPLRATPSATHLVESLVAAWRFRPAREADGRTRSRVLVAAILRPPQLHSGPAIGSPPKDLAAPSDEVPFPIQQIRPPYPPNVVGAGVVLVEVLVAPDGRVKRARMIGAGTGFDRAALGTARQWVFRPARRAGRPVPAYAYLIFGFRAPLVASGIGGGFER